MTPFESDLTTLLNRHSMENGSDTPDFLLARYLVRCLETWNATVKEREEWYGRGRKAEGGSGPDPVAPPVDTRVESCVVQTDRLVLLTTDMSATTAPFCSLTVQVPDAGPLWIAWQARIKGADLVWVSVDGLYMAASRSAFVGNGLTEAAAVSWFPVSVQPGIHEVALRAQAAQTEVDVRERAVYVVPGGDRPTWEPGDVMRGQGRRPYRYPKSMEDEVTRGLSDPFKQEWNGRFDRKTP